jgi:hypothetical protein
MLTPCEPYQLGRVHLGVHSPAPAVDQDAKEEAVSVHLEGRVTSMCAQFARRSREVSYVQPVRRIAHFHD